MYITVPLEVWYKISSKLSDKDVFALSCTCTYFYNVFDNNFWKSRFRKSLNSRNLLPCVKKKLPDNVNYKFAYKKLCRTFLWKNGTKVSEMKNTVRFEDTLFRKLRIKGWDPAVINELKIVPHRCPFTKILITPAGISKTIIKYTIQIIYEEMPVKDVFVCPSILINKYQEEINNFILIKLGYVGSIMTAVFGNGKILKDRWRVVNIGPEFLSHCMLEFLPPESSILNLRRILQNCYLKINPRSKQIKEHKERIFLRSPDGQDDWPEPSNGLEPMFNEITMTFKHELYLAPETVYGKINFANTIIQCIKDLPESVKKEYLSKIILSGPNIVCKQHSDLQYRLEWDLKQQLKTFAPFIEVIYPNEFSELSFPFPFNVENSIKRHNTENERNVYSDAEPCTVFFLDYLLYGTHKSIPLSYDNCVNYIH